MMKIIIDKYELEEKKEWYKQLKFLGGRVSEISGFSFMRYTNHMNIYTYVYNMNNNLIRIEVEKYEEEKKGEK